MDMKDQNTNRRSVLAKLALFAGGALVAPSIAPLLGSLVVAQEDSGASADENIFRELMNKAVQQGWDRRPIGEVVTAVGLSFLGAPYVAHSLEAPGSERLIVNLHAFDCTTFYESTLVLSRCIKLGRHEFDDFKRQLQFVRYRSGVLDGYPSRLHYFTDWVADNSRKNVVRDVTEELGGVRLKKHLDFMSTHVSAYRQLRDPGNLSKIIETEHQINAREQYYVPKNLVGGIQHKVQPGDIIGIMTSLEGLDASHTGMAIVDEGTVRFLHAPLSGGFVERSPHSLAEYLAGHAQQTGIVVARPLEPKT